MRQLPALSLFYLSLSLVIKLICILAFLPAEKTNLVFDLPYLLKEDLVVALIVFLIFDLALWFKLRFSRYIVSLFFLLLVFWQAVQLKIFYVFDSLLTPGMLLQVQQAEGVIGGLFAEIDYRDTLALVGSVAVVLALVFNYNSIKTRYIRTSLAALAIALAGIIFSSPPGEKNLHTLEINSLYQVVLSWFRPPVKLEKFEIVENLRQSLVQPEEIEGLSLPMSRARRNNLNIIFYTLESTTMKNVNLEPGNYYTPAMARLARQAWLFEKHYTPAPASIKAIFSIITGKYPPMTRNWLQFRNFAMSHDSLATLLKTQGYKTSFYYTGKGKTYFQKPIIEATYDEFYDKQPLLEKYPGYYDENVELDDMVLRDVTRDYLAANKNKKFFLHLNTVLPHHPYKVPVDYFGPSSGEKRFDRYINSLAYADMVIAAVYDELVKAKLAERTLFVLHSDHGEAFYEHPGNTIHSLYIYEENVHSVAMIVNPALFSDAPRYNYPSMHIDLLPTVLGVMGHEIKPGIHGTNLAEKHSTRAAFFYTAFSRNFIGIRDGNFKFIYNYSYGVPQLFDLAKDQAERKNLAKTNGPLVKKFKERTDLFKSLL